MSGCRTDFNPVSPDPAIGAALALVLLDRQHRDRGLAPPRHPLRIADDCGIDHRAEPVPCVLQRPSRHECMSDSRRNTSPRTYLFHRNSEVPIE